MGARPFEWGDLQTFLATARGGTLAGAAAMLRVDASTVQRRIGKLEAGMRTRLFDRSQRGYSLTAAGEQLFTHVLGMEEQAIAAQRKVVGRDDSLEGTVRVATVDDLAAVVLSPIVRAFRDRNPKVTIAMDIRASFADLALHQADVAIRFGWKAPQNDIVAKVVSRVDASLYASRAYLKKHGRPARLEDVKDHAIVRGDEAMAGTPVERLMDRYVDPGKIAYRSNSFFTRLAAIKEGVGLGMLGCFMGERESALERLPFRFPEIAGNLWMLVHVDLRRNARVRAFVEHAYAAMVALRPSFEAPAK